MRKCGHTKIQTPRSSRKSGYCALLGPGRMHFSSALPCTVCSHPAPQQASEYRTLARRVAATGAPLARTQEQRQEARKSRRGATNSQNQLTMPAAPQMQVNPPGSPQSACCSRLQRQTLHTAATQQWQARAPRIANTTAASYFGCGQGARGTRSDQQSPLSAPMLHTISCITLACLHAMGIAHQVRPAHVRTDVEQQASSAQVAVKLRWWEERGG